MQEFLHVIFQFVKEQKIKRKSLNKCFSVFKPDLFSGEVDDLKVIKKLIRYTVSKYSIMTDSSKIKHFENKKIYFKFKTEKVQCLAFLHFY